jgi:hypothetical protein
MTHGAPVPASSSIRLAHRGPQTISEAGTAATRPRAPTQAPKEISHHLQPSPNPTEPRQPHALLDIPHHLQRDEWLVSEGDLIGLTHDQVRVLAYRRDRQWLRDEPPSDGDQ